MRNNTENHKCKLLTITDVAKNAGVSVSTVSRVINGSTLVGKKTKVKVQKIIDEMNYIPNEMARGLIKRTSRTAALIIPDISNPFFTELIHGVEDVLNAQGYSMILCNSNFDHKKEKAYIMEMAERRVNGLIIISVFMQDSDLINRLNKTAMRIVAIQTNIEGIDRVNTNDYKGMTEAIEHLIGLGHRKIAYLCMDTRVETRLNAYKDALKRHDIPFEKDYIVEYDFGKGLKTNLGYSMTKKLLELPEPPTAIQALNDHIAFGAYMAVLEKGLEIPKDISIVGFDNVNMAKLLNPALTTVSQPIYELGEAGGELLIKSIINGPDHIQKEIVLPTQLIIRKSTDVPRK